MTSDDRRGEIDASILNHIKSKARWLERTKAVPSMDRGDYEQDLFLDLWRRRQGFDAQRSPFSAFARLITAHRAASLSTPTSRTHAERQTLSLSAALPGEDSGTLADHLPTDWRTEQDGHALALDVRRFVAGLTPAMQRCCSALASGSVSDAAADLGLNRSSIYETIARIRRHAAAAGLDAYVLSPIVSRPLPVSASIDNAENTDGRHGSRRQVPGPASACRALGREPTQPRAVALEAGRARIRENRHEGQVPRAGHRGIRAGEPPRRSRVTDTAAAAAMSDPENNVQFRRRWSEPAPARPRGSKGTQPRLGADGLQEDGRASHKTWQLRQSHRAEGER